MKGRPLIEQTFCKIARNVPNAPFQRLLGSWRGNPDKSRQMPFSVTTKIPLHLTFLS
jgi:hypothetical protein